MFSFFLAGFTLWGMVMFDLEQVLSQDNMKVEGKNVTLDNSLKTDS